MSNYIKKDLAARRKDLRAELKHLEDMKENGVRRRDKLMMGVFLFPVIVFGFNMALERFTHGQYLLAFALMAVVVGVCYLLLNNKHGKRREARIEEIKRELRELGSDPEGND